MFIKRSQIASFLDRLGVTRLITALGGTPGLLVLCYHRIGDQNSTEYDRDVISATADDFYDQVTYLKNTYGMVTLDEALEGSVSWRNRTRVLLTFDDAYLDNYTVAYPILRSLGVQGTFLLPTAFVGSNLVPWWDAIAHMISRSTTRFIRVPSLTSSVFDRGLEGPTGVSRQVLRLYLKSNSPDPTSVIREVSESTGVSAPEAASHRRFLSWDEAAEMVAGGMAIGSHSHTHPLMGGLPVEQQRAEAERSLKDISEKLHLKPRVFALPCGSFSDQTAQVLEDTGYEMSLMTRCGLNSASAWDPMRVRRILVTYGQPKSSTRLRMALMSGFTKYTSLVEAL